MKTNKNLPLAKALLAKTGLVTASEI